MLGPIEGRRTHGQQERDEIRSQDQWTIPRTQVQDGQGITGNIFLLDCLSWYIIENSLSIPKRYTDTHRSSDWISPVQAATTDPCRSPRHSPVVPPPINPFLVVTERQGDRIFPTNTPSVQARPRLGFIRPLVFDFEAPCCRGRRAVSCRAVVQPPRS